MGQSVTALKSKPELPAPGLPGLLRAEVSKLTTTRTWRWLLLATTLLALAATAGVVLSADSAHLDLNTTYGVRTVVHVATTSGSMFVLVLGIIGMAGEFRTGTIVDTLLSTPRRGRVIVAKLLTYAGVGLGFGCAAATVAVTAAIPLLASRGASLRLGEADVWLTLVGAIAWSGLYGAIGVSIGALARNQAAAIVGALAWIFVLEQVAINLFADAGRWLPASAAAALGRAPAKGLLSMAAGGAVLFVYAIVFALTAARLTMRRDVT